MAKKNKEQEAIWGSWKNFYNLIFQLLKTNMISKYQRDYETCLDCLEDLEMLIPLNEEQQNKFNRIFRNAANKIRHNQNQDKKYFQGQQVNPKPDLRKLTRTLTQRMHDLGMFVPIRKLNDEFDPEDFSEKSDLA